jgi:hypothetical protein
LHTFWTGQKFPTPTPGFGDRVFYETLLRQRPDSIMAQEWCVSYGVLPHDEAERLHKKVTDRKRQMRLGGGSAATSPARKTSVKAKKRVIKEERFEPDLQVSGGDGIGTAVL